MCNSISFICIYLYLYIIIDIYVYIHTYIISQQTFVLMKTCSRRLEDVFRLRLQKTSSRRLGQDQYIRLGYTSSRRLQDVYQVKLFLLTRLWEAFNTFLRRSFPKAIICRGICPGNTTSEKFMVSVQNFQEG